MNEDLADQVLVERVQSGDKKAFELLVIRYERKLLRLVSRFVRDPDEVQDVVQDAFIKAYRAIPNFRGESAFYTWLYRIAINAAKNYLATSKRRPSTIDSSSSNDDDEDRLNPLDTISDDATPESIIASKQIAQVVNKAIDGLPDDLKSAIVMRELEGMSYEEIAEAMDCPIGTVRSRIFRAREAIAAKLKPLLNNQSDKRW